jgi:hypothetical protein
MPPDWHLLGLPPHSRAREWLEAQSAQTPWKAARNRDARPKTSRPSRQDGDEGEAGPAFPVHGTALNGSLFSTVPVSPCTFAPSERRQPPAIIKLALKR